MDNLKVVLIDLGGVLVELDGQPIRNEWWSTAESYEKSWNRWLTSDTVQAFERGQLQPDEFARRIITELGLNIDKDRLLTALREWVIGFYPNSFDSLEKLAARYELGVYSNITDLHWPKLSSELESSGLLRHYFPSHLIGRAKPNPDSFRWVAKQMSVAPSEILFLDDNQLNVDGAKRAGMMSWKVCGPHEFEDAVSILITQPL